jgi:flavin reductase (DIM6/NTAB) family NADH-FMN oxidoreductase RutF
MKSTQVNPNDFRHGMRHLAAAVNIVSTRNSGMPWGLLATAVCSVSDDPPTLLVCVNRSARSYAAIAECGRFCINVLERNQLDVARRFLSLDGPSRFELFGWNTLVTGAPAIDSALINFDCEVVNAVEAGTHMVFIGAVVATRRACEGEPLIYFNGDYASVKSVGKELS